MARTFRITILLLLIVTMWSTVRIQERVSKLDDLTRGLDLSVLDSCGIITDGYRGGSCVAIDSNLVLTAGHCLGFEDSWVEIGGVRYEIVEKWTNKNYDVGFVRIDGVVPYVKLGQMPELLDEVYLVGSPYEPSFVNTVTKGIVSHLDRDRECHETHKDLIQTDAEGAPGSSGGPLFDKSGQVVGICVTGPNPGGGVALCVPVTDIKKALVQLEEYDAT